MLLYAVGKDTFGNTRTTNISYGFMDLLNNCEECNLISKDAFINQFYEWDSNELEFVKNENQICDLTLYQCLRDNKSCCQLNFFDENDNIITEDNFDVTGKYAPSKKEA